MRKLLLLLLFLVCIKSVWASTPEQFVEQLQAHVHAKSEGPNTIGYLRLTKEAPIGRATWIYVKMALDYYKEHKPAFILFELDTPGGELFAAEQIADALKDFDTQYGVPTVALINNWAISAGALLAYSSRFIVTMKDGCMGAAQPVTQGAEGQMQEASEKVNSALRADFANRANFFGRNPLLAEGMVDPDLILVRRQAQIIALDDPKEIRSSDELIKAKGKLLTLTAQELLQEGVADALLQPMALPAKTTEEELSGEWPLAKSPLIQIPFFAKIPHATIDAFALDWRGQVLAWLAHPMVQSLLVLGLIIGFYIEVNTPGFGLAGLTALFCLLLIVLSSFSLEAARWLELILLLLGIGLILLEIFVLPSFGLAGVLGIILAVAGLFLMLLPALSAIHFSFDTGAMNVAGQAFLEGLGWLCGTLLVALVAIVLLGKFVFPRFQLFRRLVLSGEQESKQGYVAGPALKSLPALGAKGVVYAPLRPAGKVMIENMVYDAISRGAFIDQGAEVIVVQIEGMRMIVEVPERPL